MIKPIDPKKFGGVAPGSAECAAVEKYPLKAIDIAAKMMHAGPAPVGTVHADRLPDMTLEQIGSEMMAHGGWIFRGRIDEEFSSAIREAVEGGEAARFEDFALFAFGPNGQAMGDVFALAVERSSQFPDRRVVTLYVRAEILDEPGKIADHAHKIVKVFSELHAEVVRKSVDLIGDQASSPS